MITCTRRLTFCAGHRVLGHESKCAHPHGHNYVVYVTAEAEQLDDVGRVIDFSVLKEEVGGWVDTWWDHGFLLADADTALRAALAGAGNFKTFVMRDNPTAENMARYLLHNVCPVVLAGKGVRVVQVRVEETENCYADAQLPGE